MLVRVTVYGSAFKFTPTMTYISTHFVYRHASPSFLLCTRKYSPKLDCPLPFHAKLQCFEPLQASPVVWLCSIY